MMHMKKKGAKGIVPPLKLEQHLKVPGQKPHHKRAHFNQDVLQTMDGRDQPKKLKPLHFHKKKLSMQHAVRAPGMTEKDLRMMHCVVPDAPGFDK